MLKKQTKKYQCFFTSISSKIQLSQHKTNQSNLYKNLKRWVGSGQCCKAKQIINRSHTVFRTLLSFICKSWAPGKLAPSCSMYVFALSLKYVLFIGTMFQN
ncbi:conserved hypothetical protein [Trichinella spiralis]|uniref:hypothetical protein n=1 Tax=Trichinella spiralis TaxID=6334 RepID=UPI0001EFBFC3|nr:conserved hypothetical protein [Trichinella spiralis]